MARNGVSLQNSNLLSNDLADFAQTFLSMIGDSLHIDTMISIFDVMNYLFIYLFIFCKTIVNYRIAFLLRHNLKLISRKFGCLDGNCAF